MKIAFVGGTRFVGRAAVERAILLGIDVYVIHRGVHKNEVTAAKDVLVNRLRTNELRRVLRHINPDVVIDTGSYTRQDAVSLASALGGFSCHIVVLSSQDVYAQFGLINGLPGPPPEPLITESSPLTIPFPYRKIGGHHNSDNYDKKEVEAVFHKLALSSPCTVTVLRLPLIYGEHDYRRRFGTIVDLLDTGERLLPCIDGAKWRCTHSHVFDVAHAITLAATNPLCEYLVLNVGENHTPNMRERVESIASCMSRSIKWQEVESLPDDLDLLGRFNNDFVVESSKIRKLLGFFEIMDENKSLTDLIRWSRISRDPC